MTPKVEVHIVCYNEEHILPYTLRHYATFAGKIVLHDSFSTDHSREIARAAGAEVRDWDTGGQVNDELLTELKNTCWNGTDADWAIVADADEFIYFPEGAAPTLESYSSRGVAIVKPQGYEMTAETFPSTGGQIYEEVKLGAKEGHFYDKPILFSPKMISESGLGIGAHESRPVLRDGRTLNINYNWPYSTPPVYLLHFHHVGPVEFIAARYDRQRARASAMNRKMRWGSFRDGMVEATDQRQRIKAGLVQVIA